MQPPWLLDVADHGMEPQLGRHYVVTKGGKALGTEAVARANRSLGRGRKLVIGGCNLLRGSLLRDDFFQSRDVLQ
jgi:hypothetical protein